MEHLCGAQADLLAQSLVHTHHMNTISLEYCLHGLVTADVPLVLGVL
jgi:hypothetical protein